MTDPKTEEPTSQSVSEPEASETPKEDVVDTLGDTPAPEPDPTPVPDIDPGLLPVSEPVDTAPPPAKAEKNSGGGAAIVGGIIGAALVAAAGYAGFEYGLLPQQQGNDISAIEQKIAALEAASKPQADLGDMPQKMATLERALSELYTKIDQADTTDTSAYQAQVARLGQEVAALSQKLNTLSHTPQTIDPAQTQAMIDKTLAQWQAQNSASIKAQAQAAQNQSRVESAYQSLGFALETGAPYSDALTGLGLASIPNELSAYAQTGLPSIAALTEEFAPAARQALAHALKETTEGQDSIWTFLRLQTGARSLTPQEGTDPDAVLSRAQAAVAAGDIAKALQELQSLPPAAQSAMQPWIATATSRLNAQNLYKQLAPAAPKQEN